MKNILLAGATGYAGGYILKALKNQGYHVRALSREKLNSDKLKIADEIFIGEITQPETLSGCCDHVECVISTVGITKQKDGLQYMDVDYQGNANLLNEALKNGVKKFIYIASLNAYSMATLKMIEAKEKFVLRLNCSPIQSVIIRPSGYFSDIEEVMHMAQKGTVWLFGDGNAQINPIHGADLGMICTKAISSESKEWNIGGPDTFTYNEIAALAFDVLNKKPKIKKIPLWVRHIILKLMRTYDQFQNLWPHRILHDCINPGHGW